MTAPVAGEPPPFQPGTRGAATLRSRRPPSKSLALGRLERAVRRQWLLFATVAVVVAVGGIAYDLSGGATPLSAALFWLPLAIAAGLIAAALREFSRNTITSLSSFGKHRGYGILGASPELTERSLRQLPPDKRSPLGALAFQAASPFATAFRDLQGVVGKDGIVAFTGAHSGEGATTAALCTAISATQQGRSTVLIDCDLRRRALTRELGFDPDEGVLDASERPDRWQNYVGEEDETGVHFIPAARGGNAWRGLSSSAGFPRLLESLREHYDLIILDCPPVSRADALAITSLADHVVLVTAWDRTRLSAVRAAMQALHRRPNARTSVYVNRVPPDYRFGRLRGE